MERRRSLDSARCSQWKCALIEQRCMRQGRRLAVLELGRAYDRILRKTSNEMPIANARSGSKQKSRPLHWLVACSFLFCNGLNMAAQTSAADSIAAKGSRTCGRAAVARSRRRCWVRCHTRTAEMDFYLGTALARLERWPQAEAAFEAGQQACAARSAISDRTCGSRVSTKALCAGCSFLAAGHQAESARRSMRSTFWGLSIFLREISKRR